MVLSKMLPRIQSTALFRRAYHDQRAMQNRKPQGLTWESLRRHYSLQPLFFIMGCVATGAVWFAIRSLYINVDFVQKENRLWDNRNKQTKLVNFLGRDFDKAFIAPDFKKMTEEEGENYEMPIKNHQRANDPRWNSE